MQSFLRHKWIFKKKNFRNKMDVKEKTLIVYYSRKGENYFNGNIVTLPVGNTEVMVKIIQELTGGEIFEIETVKPYPADYKETTNVALEEKKKNARPELTGKVENLDSYGVIYLGYPNWWGTFPMVVFTFLESYDFSGKSIIPFCTHEGSGLGSSERDIQKLCQNAKVLPGIAVRGRSVKNSGELIRTWLDKY
jgi:flavodoxin